MRINTVGDVDVPLAVSSGVLLLREGEVPAWLPCEPWHPLSKEDVAEIAVGSSEHWPNDLTLVRVPDSLVEFARCELVERLAVSKGGENDSLARSIASFRTHFCSLLKDSGFGLDDAGPADLVVNPPGVESTAYDYENHRLIGLHIDDHQSLSFERRDEAQILANLNIGWCERHLYVHLRDFSEIIDDLGLQGHSLAPREIKDLYFRRHPESMILRVTIPPAVAYLLNTQNCIHDGATPPGDLPDVTFHAMGYPR